MGSKHSDVKSRRRDWFLVILVSATLLVRIGYLLSYPFFIEGDGTTYYQLLLESHAHLLHATGYIFLFLPFCWLAKLIGTEPANLLLYLQPAVTVASVAVLYLALKRLVPRWISFLTCLPLGIDAQMVAAAGTTRPEFLQADILMLLLSLAIFGLTSVSERGKRAFYFGTGVLGIAGYLTKYNFLPLLVFCLIPVFDAGLQWKSRLRMLGTSCVGGAMLLVLFITTFHYPTTGSIRLNREHGWIHILKLKEAGIPLLPTNGIATEKYIILAEALPPLGTAGPGPWKAIHEIPATVRAPFRARWRALLETNDATYVRAAFDAVGASEGRRTSYYDPDTFYPIYHYLGLKEGEKLLRAVFFEGVRGYSRKYLSNVWTALAQSTDFSDQYRPYLPVPGVYETPGFFWSSPPQLLPPRPRVFKAVDWPIAQPKDVDYLVARIWRPGARLFSFLAFIKYVPISCFWIVMLAGFVVVPVFVARHGRLRPVEILFILTAAALLGEMSFAAVFLVFRSKELILCQPLIYLMMGVSISLWVKFASRAPQHT